MDKVNRQEKTFHIIIVLSAVIGMILNVLGSKTPLKQFTYFTLQSNLLVAIIYTVSLILKKQSKLFVIVKYQAVLAIVLTGLVFNILLRPVVGDYDYNPNTISDFLIHTLTPILVLLEVIFYQNKGLVKVYYPLVWLVFPLFYWLFTLLYVALGGNFNGETYVSDYPYFFLNFADNGYWGFILVLVFILFIGYLIYYVDKTVYLRKQQREVENGDI
jgi:hypothetical protein